jgi:hypothetical protein
MSSEREQWRDELTCAVKKSIHSKRIRVRGKWCFGNSIYAVQKIGLSMYVRPMSKYGNKIDTVFVMEESYFNRHYAYCEEHDDVSSALQHLYGSELKACRKITQREPMMPGAFWTKRLPMERDSFVRV